MYIQTYIHIHTNIHTTNLFHCSNAKVTVQPANSTRNSSTPLPTIQSSPAGFDSKCITHDQDTWISCRLMMYQEYIW